MVVKLHKREGRGNEVWIERTSFDLKKIYWKTHKDLISKINALRAKKIISIEETTPEFTTAEWRCSAIYYEYYI